MTVENDKPDTATYTFNETLYQRARVIQSIASILTIPITSAVCSAAAVVFVQRHGKASNITMQQLLVLADKGWTDTGLYSQLFKNPQRWWRGYCSSFLLVAIVLHIVGGLVSPLQALLISSKTIKVVGSLSEIMVYDIFAEPLTKNAVSMLSAALINRYDTQVWPSANTSSAAGEANCDWSMTLANLHTMADPFLTPLPMGYNTGVLRQFAPRINSSAIVTYINSSEYPSNCSGPYYGLHAQYSGVGWGIEICYPVSLSKKDNSSESPWRNTRARQEFIEVLYINLTLQCIGDTGPEPRTVSDDLCLETILMKITARTTGGWFELPNYLNAGVPGPLQTKDPVALGYGSVWQAVKLRYFAYNDFYYNRRWSSNRLAERDWQTRQSPGPLLIMAWAMFAAPSSYVATCTTSLNDAELKHKSSSIDARFCSSPPLVDFLPPRDPYSDFDSAIYPPSNTSRDFRNFFTWLAMLKGNNETDTSSLSRAFTSGLFIANEVWMEHVQVSGRYHTVSVYSDPGRDTVVPNISFGGMIAISVLLAIYLAALLLIASYAAMFPRWTQSTNGFAMMRIGSAIAEKVPLTGDLSRG
ncbi:uncharacterized protein MYU51_019429 [Penicillium brevicompactum]|uniref:uncharacterized protein n=1 Tax=Penicillium brevicompactum TaxID=5074 RepID=UPI0025407B7B|nr:uncharacterized protein N7506_006107 [Penicillium brevicompactum]KAJ5332324.1 hypothetical protein N7506_006107 [Penicillium brevicompactum]